VLPAETHQKLLRFRVVVEGYGLFAYLDGFKRPLKLGQTHGPCQHDVLFIGKGGVQPVENDQRLRIAFLREQRF